MMGTKNLFSTPLDRLVNFRDQPLALSGNLKAEVRPKMKPRSRAMSFETNLGSLRSHREAKLELDSVKLETAMPCGMKRLPHRYASQVDVKLDKQTNGTMSKTNCIALRCKFTMLLNTNEKIKTGRTKMRTSLIVRLTP